MLKAVGVTFLSHQTCADIARFIRKRDVTILLRTTTTTPARSINDR